MTAPTFTVEGGPIRFFFKNRVEVTINPFPDNLGDVSAQNGGLQPYDFVRRDFVSAVGFDEANFGHELMNADEIARFLWEMSRP